MLHQCRQGLCFPGSQRAQSTRLTLAKTGTAKDSTSAMTCRHKKSSRPFRKTLRIVPASSSSPVPQPSKEHRSLLQPGLLAHGSSYSPHLPGAVSVITASSLQQRQITDHAPVAIAGFVPIYSGGTARDSHPLPLTRGYVRQHNRRARQSLSRPRHPCRGRFVRTMSSVQTPGRSARRLVSLHKPVLDWRSLAQQFFPKENDRGLSM